jgi:hypothetical protein
MKLSEKYPAAHAKYVVRRDGVLFTATPCYGMHKPWWVVRVMGEAYEADPEPMKPDDEWWPVDQFGQPNVNDDVNGVGELFRSAEGVLKWRAKILLISLPYKPEMDGLAYALTDLSTTVEKFRQGSPSKPSMPGE